MESRVREGNGGYRTGSDSDRDKGATIAAEWLLSLAGRYSGGPGNTAARADEILRAEIGKKPG